MKLIIDYFEPVMDAVPKSHGFSYTDFARAHDIYYPMPINYLVRYWQRYYWRFLGLFYWVGLIDIGEAEGFSWRDFYRIKTH